MITGCLTQCLGANRTHMQFADMHNSQLEGFNSRLYIYSLASQDIYIYLIYYIYMSNLICFCQLVLSTDAGSWCACFQCLGDGGFWCHLHPCLSHLGDGGFWCLLHLGDGGLWCLLHLGDSELM